MIDGEAVILRPDNSFDFEALRSRQGQAAAILVAYDVMQVDGQDVRSEPLEERRKRLAKLLCRKNKAMREGVQLSEGLLEKAQESSGSLLNGPRGYRLEADRLSLGQRPDAAWLKTKNPNFERR